MTPTPSAAPAEPSDEQLKEAFTLYEKGPNPYYQCKRCGETEPGIREFLVSHWQSHLSPPSDAPKGEPTALPMAEPVGAVTTRMNPTTKETRTAPELFEKFKDLPARTLLYASPTMADAIEKPTLPKAAYSLDLNDGHPAVAYSAQQMYDFANASIRDWLANKPAQSGDPAEAKDDSDQERTKPVGYVAASELSRLRSGHDATLRSAKFGPSALDGDVPVFLAQPSADAIAAGEPTAKWWETEQGRTSETARITYAAQAHGIELGLAMAKDASSAGTPHGAREPVAPGLGDTFEPTMNINALPGTLIRFRAGGGYDGEIKAALNAGFVKNAVYTVKRCDIGSSMTQVLVDELSGRWNSCLFADVAREPSEDAKDAARVPMTNDQIDATWNGMGSFTRNDHRIFARAVERFHGIWQSAKEKQ